MATQLRTITDLNLMSSYATLGNLERAVSTFNDTLKYIPVKNGNNRYTAIFTNALQKGLHMEVISKGFLVVG